MHRFSRQVVIHVQPHRVFDFLTDQSKLPLWSPEVVSSEVKGGGPVKVGSKLIQKRRLGRRVMTHQVEVTTHDRPRTHAVRIRIMGVELSFSFSLWPEGRGTKVTVACVSEGRALAKLWEGKMVRIVEKAADQRIERLKAAIERGGR